MLIIIKTYSRYHEDTRTQEECLHHFKNALYTVPKMFDCWIVMRTVTFSQNTSSIQLLTLCYLKITSFLSLLRNFKQLFMDVIWFAELHPHHCFLSLTNKSKAEQEMSILHISQQTTIRRRKNCDKLSLCCLHPPTATHSMIRWLAASVWLNAKFMRL